MLKIEQSPYNLMPLAIAGGMSKIEVRSGAILKVTWPNGNSGYSDIMPRKELGDQDLQVHFENFKKGHLSDLMEQAIFLAKNDSAFRSLKKNAFDGTKKVKNNYFISNILGLDSTSLDGIKSQNFSSLLIDLGRDLEAESVAVRRLLRQSNLSVRLDFNAKADWSSFERFMTNIEPGLRARIEFIEDPIPYDPDSWKEAARLGPLGIESQLKFVDWSKPTKIPPIKVISIRPSRIDIEEAIHNAQSINAKMLITSSLEHPVSVAHATLVASDLMTRFPNQVLDHDCLYQNFFAPHLLSGSLMTMGPYIVTSKGTGIGFDRNFAALKWSAL